MALAYTEEMSWFCGESHIPMQAALQAAAQASSPPCPFQGQLNCGVGSHTAGEKAGGHKSGPGKLSPVLWCRLGSQTRHSEMVRAAPLPLQRACSGRGLPCPQSSQNDSAEAVQHFSSAVPCPEHPRARPQLIRLQEPDGAGCSAPGAPAHPYPPYSSASATQMQSWWLPLAEVGEGWVLLVSASLTLEMESGMLKSFPPCSLKPQGAGPFSITL